MRKVWVIFIGIMLLSLACASSNLGAAPIASNLGTATVSGAVTITDGDSFKIEKTSTKFFLNANPLFPSRIITPQIQIGDESLSAKETCEVRGWHYVLNRNAVEIIIDNKTYSLSGCFPLGYHQNGYYCEIGYDKMIRSNVSMFIPQKNAPENCSYDFECKSNFCFNGECVDVIKTVDDEVIRINKSDLEELRNIIENTEASLEEDYDEEVSKSFFSSLLGWFRNIFKD